MSKTYGGLFHEALKCRTRKQAEEFLIKEANETEWQDKTMSFEQKIDVLKSNLGYMAGYYDDKTAQKIHRLFGAVHPIFGTSTYNKDVTPEQAFEKGVALARQHGAKP